MLTFHDFPVGRVCRGITLKNGSYSLRVGDYPKIEFNTDSYLNGPCIGALSVNRVRYFRGRVSNFNQSEARKHCFLASDWSKFETLPR